MTMKIEYEKTKHKTRFSMKINLSKLLKNKLVQVLIVIALVSLTDTGAIQLDKLTAFTQLL